MCSLNYACYFLTTTHFPSLNFKNLYCLTSLFSSLSSLSHSLTLSLSHTHLSLSHTHTHSLSLSLSAANKYVRGGAMRQPNLADAEDENLDEGPEFVRYSSLNSLTLYTIVVQALPLPHPIYFWVLLISCCSAGRYYKLDYYFLFK